MTRRSAITIGASIGVLGTVAAVFGLLSKTLEIASYPFRLPAVGLGMVFPGMQNLPGFLAILIILLVNAVIWGLIGWGLHVFLGRANSTKTVEPQ